MNAMILKRPFTRILTVLIFLFSINLNGQISKGDFMVDFYGSMSYNNFEPESPTTPEGTYYNPLLRLRFSYMKMVTNRLMLGGGLGVFNGAKSDINTVGGREFYPYNTYQFSPQLRYYFYNKKIAFFASVDNYFSVQKFKDSNFQETSWNGVTTAGLGVDYFLSKNVALESTLKTNVIKYNDNYDNRFVLHWNTSLKLFLTPGFSGGVDSLASKVLKKGNISTALEFNLTPEFGDKTRSYLRISPSVSYFITDKINFFINSNYLHNKSINADRNIRVSFGGNYYQKIVGDFYTSLGLGTELRSRNFEVSGTRFLRSYSLFSDCTFHYFKKQKRFYAGIHYDLFKSGLGNILGTNTNQAWAFNGGLDYYVSDNFYLNANIYGYRSRVVDFGLYKQARLSVGVGYLFNNENFKL